MDDDTTGCLLRLLFFGAVFLALLFLVQWADAQDAANHRGCRKIEGYSGGRYVYLWDCPTR